MGLLVLSLPLYMSPSLSAQNEPPQILNPPPSSNQRAPRGWMAWGDGGGKEMEGTGDVTEEQDREVLISWKTKA